VQDAAGNRFSAYRQEECRRQWAAALSARLTESKHIYALLRPVLTGIGAEGDYNRDLNVTFIKLHLLDPTTVLPTYCTLSKGKVKVNV
jgi:hypothetical protein